MSARDKLLEEIRKQADVGLQTIETAAVREMYRRQAEPEIWREYHQRRLDSIPRWRLVARLWHSRQIDKYTALSSYESRAALATLRARARDVQEAQG